MKPLLLLSTNIGISSAALQGEALFSQVICIMSKKQAVDHTAIPSSAELLLPSEVPEVLLTSGSCLLADN